jgi:hypothetical protein
VLKHAAKVIYSSDHESVVKRTRAVVVERFSTHVQVMMTSYLQSGRNSHYTADQVRDGSGE